MKVLVTGSERPVETWIETTIGCVGDSCDNSLTEAINGLFKTEVIHRSGPWRSQWLLYRLKAKINLCI